MRDYLANLKSICDHLALLGEPVSDANKISHILNGLIMEYESVIAIIDATKQKFDLDTVTTMLLDSEARQKSFIANFVSQVHHTAAYSDASYDDTMAFAAQSYAHPINSGTMGREQPSIPYPRSNFNSSRGRGRGRVTFLSKPSCQICHKIGHLADVRNRQSVLYVAL
ncbi:hypothetical protein QN277_025339 [Acacia crassicarpa]|uniref:Uncharacterized protein n=1 Tax=Acacia crassicarpa TaxID=499986 RepID=A0AAE1JHE5_9FABA|nr:hypothetical protein QN277_025339 [Acacia crassicarpa]